MAELPAQISVSGELVDQVIAEIFTKPPVCHPCRPETSTSVAAELVALKTDLIIVFQLVSIISTLVIAILFLHRGRKCDPCCVITPL